MDLLNDRPGPIGRAIIHENDFVPGAPRAGRFFQSLIETREDLFLIQAGNDDRNDKARRDDPPLLGMCGDINEINIRIGWISLTTHT